MKSARWTAGGKSPKPSVGLIIVISISRLYCGGAEASDGLRYGKASGPVVVYNATRQCNLLCGHCYSSSTPSAGDDQLTTPQAAAMIDDLAAFGVPVILFSGGEPLLREDLCELIARASQGGVRAALSTNGCLITAQVARRLAQAGLKYAGISLDGMQAANDRIRGVRGAFRRALEGIAHCREAGIKVGLRFTMTKTNADQLPDIFELLLREQIPRACFYHLVPAGRARDSAADALGSQQTRAALDLIIDRTAAACAEGRRLEVLTVDNHADGPYLYMKLLKVDAARAGQCLRLLKMQGGNASGQRIGCVSWNGDVHPDQFWRTRVLGNVLCRPFSSIWTDGSLPLLAGLRDRRKHLRGRCASCRWLDICNGNLRARAEAVTGDPWGDDPACYLTQQETAS